MSRVVDRNATDFLLRSRKVNATKMREQRLPEPRCRAGDFGGDQALIKSDKSTLCYCAYTVPTVLYRERCTAWLFAPHARRWQMSLDKSASRFCYANILESSRSSVIPGVCRRFSPSANFRGRIGRGVVGPPSSRPLAAASFSNFQFAESLCATNQRHKSGFDIARIYRRSLQRFIY